MPLENVGRILSGTAGSAVTAFTCGKNAVGDKVVPITTEGEAVAFIFNDDAEAGRPVGLMMPPGIVRVLSGEALDEMDIVMTDTEGRAIKADDATEGQYTFGQVIRGSSCADEDELVVVDFWAKPQIYSPAP